MDQVQAQRRYGGCLGHTAGTRPSGTRSCSLATLPVSRTYVIRDKWAFFAEVQIIGAHRQRGFLSSGRYHVGTAAFHIANNSSHSGYREAKFTFPFDEEWPMTQIKPIRLMYIRHASQSSFNGGYCTPLFSRTVGGRANGSASVPVANLDFLASQGQ